VQRQRTYPVSHVRISAGAGVFAELTKQCSDVFYAPQRNAPGLDGLWKTAGSNPGIPSCPTDRDHRPRCRSPLDRCSAEDVPDPYVAFRGQATRGIAGRFSRRILQSYCSPGFGRLKKSPSSPHLGADGYQSVPQISEYLAGGRRQLWLALLACPGVSHRENALVMTARCELTAANAANDADRRCTGILAERPAADAEASDALRTADRHGRLTHVGGKPCLANAGGAI
jgi:hypothetical protein